MSLSPKQAQEVAIREVAFGYLFTTVPPDGSRVLVSTGDPAVLRQLRVDGFHTVAKDPQDTEQARYIVGTPIWTDRSHVQIEATEARNNPADSYYSHGRHIFIHYVDTHIILHLVWRAGRWQAIIPESARISAG